MQLFQFNIDRIFFSYLKAHTWVSATYGQLTDNQRHPNHMLSLLPEQMTFYDARLSVNSAKA